jgi:hypothetical protein
MNIFFLDADPKQAAQMQCDKHVVKMVLETAQMLSTAARAQGHKVGYKSAYPKTSHDTMGRSITTQFCLDYDSWI